MTVSSEKVGLKLLHALKREKDAGKTLLDCRPVSAIAAELRFSRSYFDPAMRFLIENRLINAAQRSGGMAALPSPQGEALLVTKSGKNAWTFDRRLALYPIIISLVSLALVLAGLSRCTQK